MLRAREEWRNWLVGVVVDLAGWTSQDLEQCGRSVDYMKGSDVGSRADRLVEGRCTCILQPPRLQTVSKINALGSGEFPILGPK